MSALSDRPAATRYMRAENWTRRARRFWRSAMMTYWRS
jgi:hypothetical protein